MIAPIAFSEPPETSHPATDSAGQAAPSRQEAAHDAGLVRRFNGGDEDAFVEIITRYREKMFSLALCLLRNHADAEEITQDTFIRAHRGLANFRGDSSLYTWLHRIAHNLSRNHYWYFFRRHRHAMVSLDCTFSDANQATISDLIASDAPGPVREAENREFSTHVRVCIEKLSARHREILMLRNESNRSYDEIAQTLGIGIGTVKSRIGRARNHLRRLLAESYAGVEPAAPSSLQWFESSRPSGHVAGVSS